MKFWKLSILSLVLTACDFTTPVEQNAKAAAKGTEEVFALKNKAVIDEAVMIDRLQIRGELTYIPNTEEPYSGFAKSIFHNDQLKFLIQFKNGYVSAVKSWRSNGSAQSYMEAYKLKYDNNLLDGDWDIGFSPIQTGGVEFLRKLVAWYENDQVSTVVLFTTEGQRDERIDYFKNGQKRLQLKSKDGLCWNANTWKPNGELVEEAVVDGTGKCIGYKHNGKVDFEQSFKNGKLDGDFIIYDEDGGKWSKNLYREGELNGDKVFFNQDGSIRLIESFPN